MNPLAKDFVNFEKIGHFTLNSNPSKSLWNFNHEKKKNKTGSHVYFIAVNDIIKKIGASANKSGVNAAAGYSVGNDGQPSDRTTGIHYYIAREILLGKKVEFWATMCPTAIVKLQGIRGEITECECSIDPKIVENHIIEDYKKICGVLPEWNMQEGGRDTDWEKSVKDINLALKSKKLIAYNENESYDILMQLYHWKHNNIPLSIPCAQPQPAPQSASTQ